MLNRIALYLRSARRMRPRQLAYNVARRWLRPRRVSLSAKPAVRLPVKLLNPCAVAGIYVDDLTFWFLNRQLTIGDSYEALDWAPEGEQRLWQYNLHYFDYLRESSRSAVNKDRLIQAWIEQNPQGSRPAWEPFTTSLRIVNWTFYWLSKPLCGIPPAWLDSLYMQALWLERNDEKHILANHYFENLKALFFAGCLFRGTDASRWLRRTLAEISEQVREQTLDDGGHFERSPMYHCLMLENYLDVLNLLVAYPALVPTQFTATVRQAAESSIAFMQNILLPDKTIPLFNDSAFGIAVPPSELQAYAERLGLRVNRGSSNNVELIDLPESGYYGCRIGRDMLIIDCGDIGPDYQPGHTHCDFLSYELVLGGSKIVVDTGVSEYEPGPLRKFVRSTKAHNTVCVDGLEQSEIWGAFRVARRAKKIGAVISRTDDTVSFRGSFTGFYGVKNLICHERYMIAQIDKSKNRIERLSVKDYVKGGGYHTTESRIHLHPDVGQRQSTDGSIDLLVDGIPVASIRGAAEHDCRVESGTYCPEFGKQFPSEVLVFRTSAALPVSLQYDIYVR